MVRPIAATFCCFAPALFCGNITYQISPNPSVCHEVHLGNLSEPRVPDNPRERVTSGFCRPEMRATSESELLLTVACEYSRQFKQTWVACREKYAVDLSQPNKVRRIDETMWSSGTPLQWNEFGNWAPRGPKDAGIMFGGRSFERSGPKWSGVGAPPVGASFNQGLTRIAVNSWDGFDIEYNPLDPTVLFQSDKVGGNFWIDIYEVGSGRRLLQIQGSFKKLARSASNGRAPGMGRNTSLCRLGADI